MRVLGFSDPLVPLVRCGLKTVTRRGPGALRRFVPGQIVALGEALIAGPAGTIRYRSDGAVVRDWRPDATLPGMLAEWEWQVRVLAATYMPAWAARAHLVITDVREDEPAAISDEDACREGACPTGDGCMWSLAPELPELTAASPRAAFLAYWTRLHGAPPAPGALGTRLAFQLKSITTGEATDVNHLV